MPIKVDCSCGKKLAVKDELAGKRVKCPACAKILVAETGKPAGLALPAPPPAVPAPPAANEPLPPEIAAPMALLAPEPAPPFEATPVEPTAAQSLPSPEGSPRRRLKWPWIAGGIGIACLIGVGLFLFLSKDSQEDTELRYTVSDAGGIRSSRNRESVMKTLGMSEGQIREWANDSAAAEEKRMVGPVLQASGRSATIFGQGFNETQWESPSGKTLYTARNQIVTLTSLNREAVLKMMASRGPDGVLSAEQVRTWAEDDNAAEEMRSAIIIRAGYVEAISRGILVKPPG